MKRIINGRRYDTEAKFTEAVADYSNGMPCTDFRRIDEVLYRTNHGNWFIHGAGGAMTKYSAPCGDLRGAGERIVPLTPDEALDWLESRGETEVIEKYFADQIEEA